MKLYVPLPRGAAALNSQRVSAYEDHKLSHGGSSQKQTSSTDSLSLGLCQGRHRV